ncbi:hypothetical protein DL93DRAFT_2169738 [Clavulina sp. PMI_390]|nr:hypothetical protein DL93DRAFT_2169738 [Clavulina sp. PMI_390]
MDSSQCRSRLRQLIDALEARYNEMSDESESFDLDRTQILLCKDKTLLSSALQRVDALRTTTEEVLMAYDKEYEDLTTFHNRSENLLRPAVRLPFEILSIIFSFACWTPIMYDDMAVTNLVQSITSSQRTRKSIGSTCAVWHQAMLTTPSVWSDLSAAPILSRKTTKQLEPLPLMLQRSGTHSLTFRAIYNSISKSPEKNHIDKIVAELEGQWSRFERLSLHGSVPVLSSKILTTPKSMPLLHSIYMMWKMGDERTLDLTSASALRVLALVHPHTYTRPQPYLSIRLPPSPQLYELHLVGNITLPGAFHAIASCCEQLEVLTWSLRDTVDLPGFDRKEITSSHSLPIFFPRLRSLFVTGDPPLTLVTSEFMTMPSLSEFRLEWTFNMEGRTIPELQFTKLRQFVTTSHESDLTSFLKLHPGLEELCVRGGIRFLAEGLSLQAEKPNPDSEAESAPIISKEVLLPNLRRVWIEPTHWKNDEAILQQLLTASKDRETPFTVCIPYDMDVTKVSKYGFIGPFMGLIEEKGWPALARRSFADDDG